MVSRLKFIVRGVPLLALMACASAKIEAPTGAQPVASAHRDSVHTELDLENGVVGVRWHLLRAWEAQASQDFETARVDLDGALHLLSDLEGDWSWREESDQSLEILRGEVEAAYLQILPHLDSLSPDSPLVLLLEGLSKEKIEDLPPDASQIVLLHKLRKRSQVPIDAHPKVLASIHFFQTRGRQTYVHWLKRMGRYQDLILAILRREGLPEELLYLAMIESGFKPHAVSRSGAVGLWQFMPSTGRLEGLKLTQWIDERRDPHKSTQAAARHLRSLYQQFGDWRLAAAAYNAGRGRTARAIEKAGSRDFWQLQLPRETMNYVPLFMAATLIAQDPSLYGFEPDEIDPPLAFEEVELSLPLRLATAASCMGISQQTLKALNPELLRIITPPRKEGGYRLKVPPGKVQAFHQGYARLPDSEKGSWVRYQVEARDSIWKIARRFGVDHQLIIAANKLSNPNRIRLGQELYIPLGAAGPVPPSAAMVSPGAVYRVRPGDSLGRIARAHGVGVDQLKQWNSLGGDMIHPGDELTIWSQTAAGASAKGLVAGPVHVVRTGETLWQIARESGVAVEDLQTWNALHGALIHPGQELHLRSGGGGAGQQYTVLKGDTLYGIARKFGLQVEELARRNKIGLTTTLLAGMLLELYSVDLAD